MKLTVREIKHSVEEYLKTHRPYLEDIINNLKKSGTFWKICKIQLAIANNIISSIVNDEEHGMHSESDNIEFMMNDKADEIIELINSLKIRYQNNLKLVKGSEFFFDYVHLLYYNFRKINANRKKTATINAINKRNNKCFQYTVTAMLNCEEIKKDLQIIAKTKPYINEYNRE